jgi:uncharacterized membrane protein
MLWLILAVIALVFVVAALAVIAEVTYHRNETAEMRQLKRAVEFMRQEHQRNLRHR